MMFLTLLIATLTISAVVCFIVSALFSKPIDGILEKIVANDIAYAWTKYMKFAIYVVGISGGVNIYQLENYLRPADENFTPPDLTQERWVLEVYRTIIESLQSIAWLLLVFFVFALIAYVIVRAFEQRSPKYLETENDT
jgi:ABC-type transport system involved in multi-copper enzyme maturation permease subunit